MLWGEPADRKVIKQQVKLWASVLTLDSSLPPGGGGWRCSEFGRSLSPSLQSSIWLALRCKIAISTCWIGDLTGNPDFHANHILNFPPFLGCAVFLLCLEFFLRFFGLDLSLGLVSSSSFGLMHLSPQEWSSGRQHVHSPLAAAGVHPSSWQAWHPRPQSQLIPRRKIKVKSSSKCV